MNTPSIELNEKKICQVCGDHALSYNFNALTCESCKAFFRRNAFKDKLKCAFNNVCTINRITRKFCQKCRLRKCFNVGMQKQLIMTELQKHLKRQKIQANRNKECHEIKTKESIEKTSASKPISSGYENQIDQEHYLSTVESSTQTQTIMVDSWMQTDAVSCCHHCDSCSSTSITPPPVTTCHTTTYLDEAESKLTKLDERSSKLLDDLVIANSALEAPLESEPVLSTLTSSDAGLQECWSEKKSSLLDVINLTAIAIRRLIKMCKRICGFKALCTEDQVSLLKHGCTQMMLLRSVLNFDPDKNSWKIPHNQLSRIRVEVLKEAQGNLYEAHEAFLTTFDPRASRDKQLIYILTAIELFEPTRPNLVRPDEIKQQQECYYNLLKWYLESVFGPEESISIFHHLLNKMKELHRLCEDHIRVYLNVNPSHVEPLLIEIFDLKPH